MQSPPWDDRTPAENIARIDAQGRVVTQALNCLSELLREDALGSRIS